MRYFTFSFAYKVFEIQCIFYTFSTFQFRLAIFQVLKSHTWLMVPNWTAEVYRVVSTVWSYTSGISLLYLRKSYVKIQGPQQGLFFLEDKAAEGFLQRGVHVHVPASSREALLGVSGSERTTLFKEPLFFPGP